LAANTQQKCITARAITPSLTFSCATTGACRSCLGLANKQRLENLAFPAISTGVYGYPPEEAAEVNTEFYLVVSGAQWVDDAHIWACTHAFVRQ
jgi:hypothetical protein